MKKSIISEIKKENSRIRVLFATSALGMGVNVPFVEHIIHITPSSSIESYMQETGRAGRTGIPSRATLYYNNADIANNNKHVPRSNEGLLQISRNLPPDAHLEVPGISWCNSRKMLLCLQWNM